MLFVGWPEVDVCRRDSVDSQVDDESSPSRVPVGSMTLVTRPLSMSTGVWVASESLQKETEVHHPVGASSARGQKVPDYGRGNPNHQRMIPKRHPPDQTYLLLKSGLAVPVFSRRISLACSPFGHRDHLCSRIRPIYLVRIPVNVDQTVFG